MGISDLDSLCSDLEGMVSNLVLKRRHIVEPYFGSTVVTCKDNDVELGHAVVEEPATMQLYKLYSSYSTRFAKVFMHSTTIKLEVSNSRFASIRNLILGKLVCEFNNHVAKISRLVINRRFSKRLSECLPGNVCIWQTAAMENALSDFGASFRLGGSYR